jgi:alkylation response protein AidB-like acyl-CoA dehydrogenase
MPYEAPHEEILFTLDAIADYDGITSLPGNEDYDRDVAAAVVEEAGKLARDTLAPLNAVGDQQGAVLRDGNVTLPEGWHEAFGQVANGGWIGLAENPEFGGQGFPHTIAAAVEEIWMGGNSAFALCNTLTQGAISAIELSGTDAQKQTWLPNMVAGAWTGAMNLTEPQAGSNLGAIRTMATPEGDHYRIKGQKIFITYGDHDLTENIVHLVLARTPDAPNGTRGLSLFVAPKVMVNEDGSLGERNDIACVSLEHKMGIHASPTAVLSFGETEGAVGYLLGEKHRGLEYMFAMMNAARFGIGMQGLGIAEAAYQHARTYAAERKQGVAVGDRAEATIDHHPDVRRMLMNMKARTAAMRAIAYHTAGVRDRSIGLQDADSRALAKAEYEYLIPIVKGWLTETCQEVTYDGLQVHGGWGFIEETGAAQFVRDARIATLYEGTTGIQAADLAFRKTARDQAAAVRGLLSKLSTIAEQDANSAPELKAAIAAADKYIEWLVKQAENNAGAIAATSDAYLRAMGTVLGGALLCKLDMAAQAARPNTEFAAAQSALSRHFAATFLPQATTIFENAPATAEPITTFRTEWL